MAPPTPRRPGFSRRAQYSIFATYVIAIIGALVALLMIVTARVDPKGHAVMQGLLSDVTAPITRFGRETLAGMGDAGAAISAYINAGAKNRAMEAELKAARRKLVQQDVDALENKRLKTLLGIRQADGFPVISARLVASSGTSTRRFATLLAGANQGVREDQPVRTADGLVGRVVSVSNATARVLLVIDGESQLPVKRSIDNMPAMAIGLGDGTLEIRPLVAGLNAFKPGDVFVTSGTGGIYRPGVPVARITRKNKLATWGRPLADPATLDFALVEPVYVETELVEPVAPANGVE